jgi:hypothetical protein
MGKGEFVLGDGRRVHPGSISYLKLLFQVILY